MHTGKVIISIKYDLGGALEPGSGGEDELVSCLRGKFPEMTVQNDDLAVFNLSYLSRSARSYRVDTTRFDFQGGQWELQTLLEPRGVISMWLSSPEYSAEDPETLGQMLYQAQARFIEDKNQDYLIHLSSLGEIRGRLTSREIPEEGGAIDLRSTVTDIRDCLENFLDQRARYNFHDYRPIFLVDDESFLAPGLRRRLLSLQDETGDVDMSRWFGTPRYVCNTWSFIVREQAWTNDLAKMFSHAHSSWFQIHASIFEMKDLEDVMNRNLMKFSPSRSDDLQDFMRYLGNRKNIMFSEMFSALNSDFITKNAQCRNDLDVFMAQFGIKLQTEILREYTSRISDYLREYNDHLSLSEAKTLSRNTRVLEVLFLLSAIAGIAGFTPTLFDTDLNPTFVWDLPRMVAIVTISVSLVLYVSVVLVSRFRDWRVARRAKGAEWMKRFKTQ